MGALLWRKPVLRLLLVWQHQRPEPVMMQSPIPWATLWTNSWLPQLRVLVKMIVRLDQPPYTAVVAPPLCKRQLPIHQSNCSRANTSYFLLCNDKRLVGVARYSFESVV